MAGLNVNTIADEAGTGGPDFVAMPSVGGSPVVESGSNSDGEWMRWADGTQICTHRLMVTFFSSSILEGVWDFPAGFINPPSKVGNLYNVFSDIGAAVFANRGVWLRGMGLNIATVAVYGEPSPFSAGDEVPVEVSATGRWK